MDTLFKAWIQEVFYYQPIIIISSVISSTIYYLIDYSVVWPACNLLRPSLHLHLHLLSYSQPPALKMTFRVALFIALILLIHGDGVEASKASYGIDTVDNVCAGVGELDQLADITSQLMSSRFPGMGSIRVSCSKEQMKCFVM